MSNNDNFEKKSSSVPFFARYLEGQFLTEVSEEEMDQVQGGIRYISPPSEDIAYTLKYPSDNEDSSPTHPIVTNKHRDIDDIGSGGGFTKKYPSDADEAMTHKYPSDGDDDFSFDSERLH
ncbi:microviridin/marinostatin family tricyclic proteinase inhibitor [Plectonema cf. radiosum LEGE 06105]|uniref:Microviridin/marinostatin family tricyclic proteinase inhibitor n=1 Tax=Plectonema cf. radiosum LEGE 06105 TaxID=945769 RepID=A0A8J7F7V2_9CYAN|nr:microviridin/marinostatin family tricyclic proteinase inhibitor [Plectonema radiosum]MBE9213169.1 microviridin/marinostatin family tricyclic proteinase inhibitor [Plectonema cf. radiosum LEGE 06105]